MSLSVKKNSDESILTTSVQSFTETEVFDFCMCNPPFFADHMEAQGLVTTRSDDRPEAGSVSTASPQECIVAGGEVAFVRQMIEESTVLRAKIRLAFMPWFSWFLYIRLRDSMCGKRIRQNKKSKCSVTAGNFIQGPWGKTGGLDLML